jgi:hypothetical protein
VARQSRWCACRCSIGTWQGLCVVEDACFCWLALQCICWSSRIYLLSHAQNEHATQVKLPVLNVESVQAAAWGLRIWR